MTRLLFFLLFALCCSNGFTQSSERVKKIHSKAILVDAHNDILTTIATDSVNIETNLLGKTHSDISRFAQGGECGCCMNYSGPCYYWNKICLAHDMACQRCQHSWCFSGCVPSSCSGNTISWYWWLVMS